MKISIFFSVVLSLIIFWLPSAYADDIDVDQVFAVAEVELVDLNSADAVQLSESLKGIGESKAQAIIAYRETYGPFTSIDDLAMVKGVGSKTIADNRHLMTVKVD